MHCCPSPEVEHEEQRAHCLHKVAQKKVDVEADLVPHFGAVGAQPAMCTQQHQLG